MHKSLLIKKIGEYSIITLMALLYAVAFNCFFAANNLSCGGMTGVAQIINAFVPVLPVGILILVLNVPLFYLGFRLLGAHLLISSLYAMSISSLFIDWLAVYFPPQPMDPLLACIYGGALVGASSGILMQVGATTGGTELGARLLKLRLGHLSIGKLCLGLDLCVITAYALVFRNINNALYGLVALYITSLVTDMVVYGGNAAKVTYIISDRYQEIADQLMQLDRGVTLLSGTGAFSGAQKKVIMCAFKRNQIVSIKKIVNAVDPAAFVIVCDAHEVQGEGFATYSPDAL